MLFVTYAICHIYIHVTCTKQLNWIQSKRNFLTQIQCLLKTCLEFYWFDFLNNTSWHYFKIWFQKETVSKAMEYISFSAKELSIPLTPVTRKRSKILKKFSIIFFWDTEGDNRTPILEQFKRHSYSFFKCLYPGYYSFLCIRKCIFQNEASPGWAWL